MMRKIAVIAATLVLAPLAAAGATAEAPANTTPTTEVQTFEGVVGCSVALGPVSVADRCNDANSFVYGPSFDGLVAMDVKLTYESDLGQQLSLRFQGPPTGTVSGASPATASFDNESLPSTAFFATFNVRANAGSVALDVPFTVEIVYTYA